MTTMVPARFRFTREKVVFDDVICGQIEFDMTSAETIPI